MPRIWIFEVINGLTAAERRGRISASEIDRVLIELQMMPIREATAEPPAVLALARYYELSVYDSAYLRLAIEHGSVLATLNRKLAQAARSAGVELLPLEQ